MQESVTLLSDDITIDRSFFYEPRAFPLVDIVRKELANHWMGGAAARMSGTDRLSPLPAVFVHHMHGLYADNQERYGKVIGATEGPFVEAEQTGGGLGPLQRQCDCARMDLPDFREARRICLPARPGLRAAFGKCGGPGGGR